MNLREKAAKYIQDKGIPEIAKTLNVKEQTVKLWGNTGKYPIDLIELVMSEQATEKEPIQEPTEVTTWTPESLDKLANTLNIVVDKLQELHEWKNGMSDRFDPKPITPLPPSRTVPPAVVDDAGFVEANSVRPGPMTPTPHIVRGEAPPPMAPPPQMQPTGLNQRPQKHWLESYDYRSRR